MDDERPSPLRDGSCATIRPPCRLRSKPPSATCPRPWRACSRVHRRGALRARRDAPGDRAVRQRRREPAARHVRRQRRGGADRHRLGAHRARCGPRWSGGTRRSASRFSGWCRPSWRAAAEAFAVKFGDIGRRHRMLHGVDPFEALTASRAATIARLRQVLLNQLLRLRASLRRGRRTGRAAGASASPKRPARCGSAPPRSSSSTADQRWRHATRWRTLRRAGRGRTAPRCSRRSARRARPATSRRDGRARVPARRARARRASFIAGRRCSRDTAMVNPFDLRGPEFLVFYGCLGAAVTVLVFLIRARRRTRRSAAPARPTTSTSRSCAAAPARRSASRS